MRQIPLLISLLVAAPLAAQQEDQNADQIIIKEVYCGGCSKDEGSDAFHMDKCIVLYNNCPERVVASNLCFGMATPYNAEAGNIGSIYNNSGQLVYEDEGFIPAQNGIWYFPSTLVIEPFQQVVVNVHGAIDNTKTYSQSVNYAFKDYYCMYDPESGYTNTLPQVCEIWSGQRLALEHHRSSPLSLPAAGRVAPRLLRRCRQSVVCTRHGPVSRLCLRESANRMDYRRCGGVQRR